MSTELLIIFLLMLLNAFFALSEMAIVSASKPLLRQAVSRGQKSAERALALAENSGRFLSTVQVGITLIGTLAGTYGGATIAKRLVDPLNAFPFIAPHGEGVAVVLVVSVITYFSVVVGELIPKQMAINNAERYAVLVATPMYYLSRLCTPVVATLEVSASLVTRLLGIKTVDEGVTESEIRAVIAEGVVTGAIEHEEHQMIQRVIRLADRDVKSIITHRSEMVFIDVSDSLDMVREKISLAGHSRYPVIDRDPTNVIGIVKTKELMVGTAHPERFTVRDYVKDIFFVNENMNCLEALNTFRSRSLHLAAVIDEYGAFEGVFTTSDLMEALVGMIPSNYDNEEGPLIVQREDGSWLVDGMTPIDEIHITIGLHDITADGEYQTIAGFMLSQMKAAPSTGAAFAFAGHRFEIVDMDRRRIDKVLIQKLPADAS